MTSTDFSLRLARIATDMPATITEEPAAYYSLRNNVERFKSLCHRAKTEEERLQAIVFGVTVMLELELEKLKATRM